MTDSAVTLDPRVYEGPLPPAGFRPVAQVLPDGRLRFAIVIDPEDGAEVALRLAREISPLLAGHDPGTIGDALVELAARQLAEMGHPWKGVEIPDGAPERTDVVGIVGDIMQALAAGAQDIYGATVPALALAEREALCASAQVHIDRVRLLVDHMETQMRARQGVAAAGNA